MRNNSHNKKIKQEENNMICVGINKGKHNFKIKEAQYRTGYENECSIMFFLILWTD